METSPQLPARLAFGPFEVDERAGEVRKNGERIRLAPQPFQILLLLLAHPGGVVTREQLHEKIWSDGTNVDFERGLNSAMTKLRRTLADDPENPRYIETHPGRGYRFIGVLKDRDVVHVPVSIAPVPDNNPPPLVVRKAWKLSAALGIAAVLTVSLILGLQLREKADTTNPPWKLSRLTADTGFSASASLSPDGKLIGYSSDLSQEGERDLYVKQVSGGQPIRITKDGAGNTNPDFSPDGTKIAFRSNRDGGGIYQIPVFGGEISLLAKHGLNPRFSPDGSQVAYWVGDENIATAVPGGGEVWVVSATGGTQPHRIGASFTNARYPIWSPDGKHLLFIGYTADKAAVSTSIDWWFAATDGEVPVRTGIYDALTHAGLQLLGAIASPSATFPSVPIPSCWLAGENSVIFSARNGDTQNLWATGISPRSGKVTGVFKRLTTGAGNEVQPSCASANAITFTNVEDKSQVWSIPFGGNQDRSQEDPVVVAPGPLDREPSISTDGRFVAFASTRSGSLNVWLRDLQTGNESHVASSSIAQRSPIVNATGRRIVYSAFENSGRSLYLSNLEGTPEKICEGCLRATDWSHDEKSVLVFGGSPYQIDVLDLATHERAPLVTHPIYSLLSARFSADSHWISFTARTQSNRAIIAIAPLGGPKPIPESAWIKIADAGPEDRSNWAPDGKTLYYTSLQDGHTCLWGQHLDATTHKPAGEVFAVRHFHGRRLYQQGGFSMSGGRLTVALVNSTANIWMMSRSATL